MFLRMFSYFPLLALKCALFWSENRIPRQQLSTEKNWQEASGASCAATSFRAFSARARATLRSRSLPRSLSLSSQDDFAAQERPQERPKRAQEQAKNGPIAAQERPRASQERARAPQERTREPQERLKLGLGVLSMLLRNSHCATCWSYRRCCFANWVTALADSNLMPELADHINNAAVKLDLWILTTSVAV